MRGIYRKFWIVLLPANVLELPNAGDLTLEEMQTGVWIQTDPEEMMDAALLTEPETGPYRLGVGDVLEITLYGEGDAETRRVLPIDPAGNISYMLLGTIPAAGRTIDELTADMRKRLEAKLNYSILSIVPSSFGSQTYTVLGQLYKPQVYPLQGKVRILDAIAQAGGPQVGVIRDVSADIHDFSHATLVRQGEVVPVDFERLVYEADGTQNIELRAGDILTIPSALERKIYALGAFNNPHAVQFASSDTSLMNVVIQAGGINREISDGHVIIVRGKTTSPKIMLMDLSQFNAKTSRIYKILGGRSLDMTLRPGDIVYCVPKRFQFWREVVKQAVNTFGTTLAGDAATDMWQEKIDPFDFGTERPL
jgi:polysaccharide biosynthesis/export protein